MALVALSSAYLVFGATGSIEEWSLVDDAEHHGIREVNSNGDVVLNDE